MDTFASKAALAFLLLVSGACGSEPTEPVPPGETNSAPSVQLMQAGQQSGRVPSTLGVTFRYEDGDTTAAHAPTTASLVLDGEPVETPTVFGRSGTLTVTTPPVDPGMHTVEVEVCDGGGLCGSDAGTVEVRSADYSLHLRVFDGTDFFPAAHAEVCLGEICGTTDAEGRVTLTNTGTEPRAITVPEEYRPDLFAGLSDARTGHNYFDQTPVMARAGHVPLDTLIELGENRRTVLLFKPDFPFEEYAERWFPESQPSFRLAPGRPHRVIWDASEFQATLQVSQEHNNDLPQAQVDTLFEDIREMIELVSEEVYVRIGFEEPKPYGLAVVDDVPNLDFGHIRLNVDRGDGLYFFKHNWDEQHFSTPAVTRTHGFRLRVDHVSRGFRDARWQARAYTFIFLCGIDSRDIDQAGGLTTYPAVLDAAVWEPSEDELAMCVMATALGDQAIVRETQP